MIRRLMFRSTRKIKMYKTDRAALCRIANAIAVMAGVLWPEGRLFRDRFAFFGGSQRL